MILRGPRNSVGLFLWSALYMIIMFPILQCDLSSCVYELLAITPPRIKRTTVFCYTLSIKGVSSV